MTDQSRDLRPEIIRRQLHSVVIRSSCCRSESIREILLCPGPPPPSPFNQPRLTKPQPAAQTNGNGARTTPALSDTGLSSTSIVIDPLVANATAALAAYADFTQEQIDFIVKKAAVAALAQHGELAQAAVAETGRGVFEDKAVKNIFVSEQITHSLQYLKTVGVISDDEISGIVEIAEPVGVVCGITPVTNPTSTAIFKSLIALKTRNPIIFAFHPGAQQCSSAAARVVRDAAIAAGAPANCIQWVEHPSIALTDALMNHPGVALILATGGNAMVKAAYSCGKPALGVGAGNVPAFIERTAKLRRAVNDVVASKSFDNGMVCASRAGRHSGRADLRGRHGRIREAARLPLQSRARRRPWNG